MIVLSDSDSQEAVRSEAMTPQRIASWTERLSKLSRVQLIEIAALIKKQLGKGRFDAELEIASKHCDLGMVHRTIRDEGRRKLQEIYCSEERCSICPHGPFWFVFRTSESHGATVR